MQERDSVRSLRAAALLVAGLMLFVRLGSLPLAEPDEGRNAEVGREMLASGAWLVPTYDGLPYLDKPAFFFRSVAISFALLGESEAAARLPSALSGLAMLAMLFAFCRQRYGEVTACLAVLVASTAPLFFAFSRLVIMDAMLGCFVCASIFAAFLAEEAEGRRQRLWYVASAAAAGFATLVKGPVGFLVPGLVMLAFHLLDRRRGAVRRCFAPLNVLVFLAVVLPWFVSLCLRQPGFLYYGLVEESFHRFTTGSFHRSEPFWFYLPVLLAGLFPWSVILPGSAVLAWKRRALGSSWRSADRLFLVWTVAVVVFFSISHSKLAGYVLTAVVALAALIARVLTAALQEPGGRAERLLLRGAAAGAFFYGVLVAALLYAAWHPELFAASSSSQKYERLLSSFPDLAAGLALGGALTLAAWLHRAPRLAIAGLALLLPAQLTIGFGVLHAVVQGRSSRALTARIGRLPAGTGLACLECFPEGLSFYRKQPVTIVSPGASPAPLKSNYLLFRRRSGELATDRLVDSARLDAWIAQRDSPVFLISRRRLRGRLESLAAERGLGVSQLTPEWSGVLIPARPAREEGR